MLKNIAEVLERLLNRHRKVLRQAVLNTRAAADATTATNGTAIAATHDDSLSQTPPVDAIDGSASRREHEERPDAEKRALYQTTQELKRQGLTINQIRLRVGRHHSTIARLYGADIYVGSLHAAVLRLPLVVRGVASAVVTAQILDLEAGVGLLEDANDLLFGEA